MIDCLKPYPAVKDSGVAGLDGAGARVLGAVRLLRECDEFFRVPTEFLWHGEVRFR